MSEDSVECVLAMRTIAYGAFLLADGIQQTIYLPTMWNFVQELGGNALFYGFVLAAFSVSDHLSQSVYTFISNTVRRSHSIVGIPILIGVGGHLMYFFAFSKYMILGSRFAVGVCIGVGAILSKEMAVGRSKKEKKKVFQNLNMVKQMGHFLGPLINLAWHHTDSKIGSFPVNRYTTPGLFMAVLWMVPWLMIIFMFCDIPRDTEEEENSTKCGKLQNVHKYTVSWMDKFLREETVLILTVFFVAGFSGKVWETMLVPMAESFGWTEKDIIIYLFTSGVAVLIVLLIALCCMACLSERWLLVVGFTIEILGYAWLIGFVGPNIHTSGILAKFCAGITFILLGIPVLGVAAVMLYTKSRGINIAQDTGQSTHKVTTFLATGLGHLWAGGTIGFCTNYYLLLSVPLGLVVLALILTFASFSKLKQISKKEFNLADFG